jgi:putative transcriptional regulator
MIPTHHPDADQLLAYASGTIAEWAALVVACHLTYCPECREEIALLDDVGGALLDELPAGEAPALPPTELLYAEPKVPKTRTFVNLPPDVAALPRPLRAFFKDDAPRFRFLAPGVRHVPLSFEVGGIPARVIRFKAGFKIPEHTHEGEELVLVLDGELRDTVTDEVFRTGDLSHREPSTTHGQNMSPSGDCTCLVISTAEVVPTSAWGRFLKAIAGV